MIYPEYLKIVRNRQLIILLSIFLILHILAFFIIKNSFVNNKSYCYLSYNDAFYIHLVYYLKFSFNFTFLLVPICLIIAIKSNQNVDIENRISLSLVEISELKFNVLKALLISMCTAYNIFILFVSVGYYIYFGSKIPIIDTITAIISILLISSISLSAVISFYYVVLTYIKQSIFALTVSVTIWLGSLLLPVKIFPLQWAYEIFQNMYDQFWLNLTLLVIVLVLCYLKLKPQSTSHFFKVYFLLMLQLFACNNVRNSEDIVQLIPKDGIVYIAFSIECETCFDELNAISQSTQLDPKKISFITIDSQEDIKSFIQRTSTEVQSKIISVDKKQFLSLFGKMNFPQAITFQGAKRKQIAYGYTSPLDIVKYARY